MDVPRSSDVRFRLPRGGLDKIMRNECKYEFGPPQHNLIFQNHVRENAVGCILGCFCAMVGARGSPEL